VLAALDAKTISRLYPTIRSFVELEWFCGPDADHQPCSMVSSMRAKSFEADDTHLLIGQPLQLGSSLRVVRLDMYRANLLIGGRKLVSGSTDKLGQV